jgi:hypothetical protein
MLIELQLIHLRWIVFYILWQHLVTFSSANLAYFCNDRESVRGNYKTNKLKNRPQIASYLNWHARPWLRVYHTMLSWFLINDPILIKHKCSRYQYSKHRSRYCPMPWKNPSQISFGLGLIKTSKSIEITLNFNLKPGKKKKKKKTSHNWR